MFKFDTKTQNPKPKRWSATGGVVRRIMASFLGRRTSRLGILRPYQFSDQACAQLPDLSTWSLSHSDESPLSAPCPYLAHNARADRVRASHGGRCLKSLVCMSVVCLSCLCGYVCDRSSVHVLVHVSVRLSGSVHAHAHASFRSVLSCLSCLSCLPSLSVIVCPVSIGTDGSHALRRSPRQSVADLCVSSPM